MTPYNIKNKEMATFPRKYKKLAAKRCSFSQKPNKLYTNTHCSDWQNEEKDRINADYSGFDDDETVYYIETDMRAIFDTGSVKQAKTFV